MAPQQEEEVLPFWKVNVPRDEWPEVCPEFLEACSEKDKSIIGMWDEEVGAVCFFTLFSFGCALKEELEMVLLMALVNEVQMEKKCLAVRNGGNDSLVSFCSAFARCIPIFSILSRAAGNVRYASC